MKKLPLQNKLPKRKKYLPFGKPSFSRAENRAVRRVLASGWVGMGEETIAFEKELAAYVGAPQVLTVNSCTSALFLALLALRIGKGDEIICPSLTWCSTANCALYAGARAVFCDVDSHTMCVTPKTVLARLTKNTKAVVVVHYGGYAVDVAALRKALPKRVAIIEDAAHALGAKYKNGKPVGSSGNLTCFSFYANKNLSTGEGGAIAVADEKMAEHIKKLRLHGYPSDAWLRYVKPLAHKRTQGLTELGYKMNYTDLQAAIGRVQLKRQKEFNKKRLALAKYYAKELKQISTDILLQENVLSPAHARHLFVVQLPLEKMTISRDDFMMALRAQGIGAAIHYLPLHKMQLYKKQAKLPVTEELAERILTLPFGASITQKEAERVMQTFAALFKRYQK